MPEPRVRKTSNSGRKRILRIMLFRSARLFALIPVVFQAKPQVAFSASAPTAPCRLFGCFLRFVSVHNPANLRRKLQRPCHNSRRPRIRKRKAIPSPYFGLRKHGLKHALFAGSLREQRHAPFEEILDRRVAVAYNDRPSIRKTSAELLKSARSFNASALDFNCRQLRPL